MTNSSNSEHSRLGTLAWRGYFLLASVLGGLTILSLLQARSNDRSLLGLSASRLVIIAVVLIFSLLTAWMFLRSFRKPGWFQRRVVSRSIDWVGKSHIYGIAVILTLLGLLT